MSANFLGADDYGLKPLDNPPLASFDQDANDNEELLVLEDLFHSTIIGIHIEEFFGLNKDNITKYETTNANSPKDLGEVDYTKAESNYLQAISANRNREININDTFESLSKTITSFHFKNSAWTRHSIKAVVNI